MAARHCKRSARDVDKKVRHFREALVEIFANMPADRRFIHRALHAAQPGVAHCFVDGNTTVTHPKPRVTVSLSVFLRTAQPSDQEKAEPRLHLRIDASSWGLAVNGRQRGLVLFHQLVKTRRQSLHDGAATNHIERIVELASHAHCVSP
jgi:hypothetical protein